MALVHFNMASFFEDGDPGCTPQNWPGASGSSNPASFAPTALNASQWVDSMVAIGATEAVLTAKHGCGFYLWPTQVLLPNGTRYPYRVTDAVGDVVQQFVDATSARGLGHGFYYSLTNNFFLNVRGHSVQPNPIPGQYPGITQQQFEDLAFDSLKELWTNYGTSIELWFDGGYTSDMKARLTQLLQSTQPNACAFGGWGITNNSVRWCGSEGGSPPGLPTIWSTDNGGGGAGVPPNTPGAAWSPSGVDFTLQQGDHWCAWGFFFFAPPTPPYALPPPFPPPQHTHTPSLPVYTPGLGLRSLSELILAYHNSVGANGKLELDFAIDRTGNLAPAHVAAYARFGAWIKACYGAPLATATPPPGAMSVVLPLPGGAAAVDRVVMREDQRRGQAVNGFTVEYSALGAGGPWLPFGAGVTIGTKRILIAPAPVTAAALRLTLLPAAFSPPVLRDFAAFAPGPCALPTSRARFVYPDGRCLATNASGFPCAGGANNACPVFLADCASPAAVWDDAEGTLMNVFWGAQSGQPAGINIDCNSEAPGAVAKLLGAGAGWSANSIAFAGGQLVYARDEAGAPSLCLDGGQGPDAPPCGHEPRCAGQVTTQPCSSGTAGGWVRQPAA